MPRTVKYRQTDFSGGINQEYALTKPNQVLDARNVWAPNGVLRQRPGSVGVYTRLVETGAGTSVSAFLSNADTTFTAVGTLNFPSGYESAVSDYMYLITSAKTPVEYSFGISVANTKVTHPYCEYWDGSRWVYCPATRTIGSVWWSSVTQRLRVTPPRNATTTTVNGQSVGLRIRWLGDNVDVGTTVTTVTAKVAYSAYKSMNLAVLNFPNKREIVSIYFNQSVSSTTGAIIALHGQTLQTSANFDFYKSVTTFSTDVSWAVIPEFNTAFVALGKDLYEYNATLGTIAAAVPETNPLYVGVVGAQKADLHPDYIANRGIPSAKFVAWYQNHLFAFGLQGAENAFCWSAPTSANVVGFRVWPTVSFDYLSEDDNSPISGVTTLGEHLIVFKGDSMWRIVNAGPSSAISNLSVFSPVKITSTVGCASHKSIVKSPVGLCWLAEDGFYNWDGASIPKKISEPIDDFFRTYVNPYMLNCSSGVVDTEHHCVMWSVFGNDSLNPTTAYTNANGVVSPDKCETYILVWDYKYNAWWIWDNIGQVVVASIEDINTDRPQIYWMDAASGIARLTDEFTTDVGQDFNMSVLTSRFGFGAKETMKVKEVEVVSSNLTDTLTVDVVTNDNVEEAPQGSLPYVDRNSAETTLGSFVLDTNKVVSKKFRARTLHVNDTCEWAQVQLTHNSASSPCEISAISLEAVID